MTETVITPEKLDELEFLAKEAHKEQSWEKYAEIMASLHAPNILALIVRVRELEDESIQSTDENEAFERWVSGRAVVTKYGAKLKRTLDGNYGDYRINDRWLAWKARAALNKEQK